MNINDLCQETIVIKPWGKEIIYTPSDSNYTLKKIVVNDGCRLSLQSHNKKIETFVLVGGEANLIIGPDLDHLETFSMELGKGYNISLNLIHRLMGVKNAEIIEGSTPELGTTIRYQDDYKRLDETEDMRQQENRGWNPNNSL
jgi:mannose-6-phosphate isomerase-like protein (cupin superfamily)